MTAEAEFARPIRLDTLGDGAREIVIAADPVERNALATRFRLVSVGLLEATATLVRTGTMIDASGRLRAKVVQHCIATDDPVPANISTDFVLRFIPRQEAESAEIELSADDCDTIEYEGGAIDLGEAVAETLALELNPFPRSPGANAALRAAGVSVEGEEEKEAGPFAGLKAMLGKQDPTA